MGGEDTVRERRVSRGAAGDGIRDVSRRAAEINRAALAELTEDVGIWQFELHGSVAKPPIRSACYNVTPMFSPNGAKIAFSSARLDHAKTTRLLAGWHEQASESRLPHGESFTLDFHSVPYYGEDPLVERHRVIDSRLTAYANLARLDELGIAFITPRRRAPKLLKEIVRPPVDMVLLVIASGLYRGLAQRMRG